MPRSDSPEVLAIKAAKRAEIERQRQLGAGYWLKRLFIDTSVGVCAGFTLACFITPMDMAAMEGMAGRNTVMGSLRNSFGTLLTRPWRYWAKGEYKVVAATYGATYLAKNWSDSFCIKQGLGDETSAFIKFWGVFAVNGGVTVFWKDPILARIVGSSGSKPAATMPRITKAIWVGREVTHVIGAVVMADYLEAKFGWTVEQWRKAQLAFPLLTQAFTTPFHLFGLDYYNHQNTAKHKVSFWKERMPRVIRNYPSIVALRGVRMFVPWSIGLVVNRDLRDRMLQRIDDVDT